MRPFALLAILLFAPALDAQRPLTVDACRADAKTLSVEIHKPGASDASYFVWSLRAEEMSKCQDIDPTTGTLPSVQRGILYMGVEGTARTAMSGELEDFIRRHGLQKQFIEDDDAGLR